MTNAPLQGQELEAASPFMNCAGSLGFAPPNSWSWPEPMGIFVTNPISLAARSPAQERALIPFAGGFLLHTGLPNPGIKQVLRLYAARWARSALPVWVHLVAQEPYEVDRTVRALEERDGVAAIELGLPPQAGPEQARALVVSALGELPLVINIALTQAGEPWLDEMPALGVSAISLGAPRGTLPRGEKGMVSGRLFGPAILPLALAALRKTRRLNIPVIASGGVFSLKTAQLLLAAGSWAVQLDAVLWK